MAELDSHVSHRALAIIFGMLALFLLIYSDLQTRLGSMRGTLDIAQEPASKTAVTRTISATSGAPPSIPGTEFFTYPKVIMPIVMVIMIIITAVLVWLVFTLMPRTRRLRRARLPL